MSRLEFNFLYPKLIPVEEGLFRKTYIPCSGELELTTRQKGKDEELEPLVDEWHPAYRIAWLIYRQCGPEVGRNLFLRLFIDLTGKEPSITQITSEEASFPYHPPKGEECYEMDFDFSFPREEDGQERFFSGHLTLTVRPKAEPEGNEGDGGSAGIEISKLFLEECGRFFVESLLEFLGMLLKGMAEAESGFQLRELEFK